MANQYVNEVIYNGNTLISLKEDTAESADVLMGKRFHLADGSIAIGTASSSAGCTLTVVGEAGDTVVITKKGEEKPAQPAQTIGEDGTTVFTGLSNGVWTITMSDETDTVSKDLNISTEYDITLSYFTATVAVTYPAESTCTVLKDGETESTPAPDDSGIWNCIIFSKGKYTFTCTNEAGDSTSDVVIVETNGESVGLTLRYAKIYGIRRDIYGTSSAWARTDDAIGKNAAASIASAVKTSDFDSCYPWNGIKRTSIGNDIMVQIPKFWYKRVRVAEDDTTMEYIKIADKPADGFKLHPAFNHGGVEVDYIDVGAYKTYENTSVAGKAPQNKLTREQFRTNAQGKGNGWGIIDISTLSAIQMLILVEFANNNVQDATVGIAPGYTNSANTGTKKTGTCEGVYRLTGRPSGTADKVGVIWRGIEDLWGNIWEWVDGVNWNDGVYSICNDPSAYIDNVNSSSNASYSELTSRGVTNWSSSYITQESYEEGEFDWVMLPTEAGGGNSSTYYCDACWSSTGWRVFERGGGWGSDARCGLFAAILSDASSYSNASYGCRLIYIPSSTSSE
jgi:hypothetical protein